MKYPHWTTSTKAFLRMLEDDHENHWNDRDEDGQRIHYGGTPDECAACNTYCLTLTDQTIDELVTAYETPDQHPEHQLRERLAFWDALAQTLLDRPDLPEGLVRQTLHHALRGDVDQEFIWKNLELVDAAPAPVGCEYCIVDGPYRVVTIDENGDPACPECGTPV